MCAQPTLIHVKLTTSQRSLFDCFLRLFLATTNKILLPDALLPGETPWPAEAEARFIQIDDVNLIALLKDEGFIFDSNVSLMSKWTQLPKVQVLILWYLP